MLVGDFTDQASAYRARPGYPAELVNQLVADAMVQRGDSVVDLGAGTGLFTRELVERGFSVTAVEPNERMRSSADLVGVRWIDGTFEATQLANQSQRWAVAAQAFHWADPVKSLPEIRRILQPRRLFTVVWNIKLMDADPIIRWTADAIKRHVSDFREYYEGANWPVVLESTGDFDFVKKRIVGHIVPMSRDRFLDLWRSHHWLQRLAKPGAFGALMIELESRFAAESVDEIAVRYNCSSWSARRRD